MNLQLGRKIERYQGNGSKLHVNGKTLLMITKMQRRVYQELAIIRMTSKYLTE